MITSTLPELLTYLGEASPRLSKQCSLAFCLIALVYIFLRIYQEHWRTYLWETKLPRHDIFARSKEKKGVVDLKHSSVHMQGPESSQMRKEKRKKGKDNSWVDYGKLKGCYKQFRVRSKVGAFIKLNFGWVMQCRRSCFQHQPSL